MIEYEATREETRFMHVHICAYLPENAQLLPKLRASIRESLVLCRLTSEKIAEMESVIFELAAQAVLQAGAGRYWMDMEVAEGQVTAYEAKTPLCT